MNNSYNPLLWPRHSCFVLRAFPRHLAFRHSPLSGRRASDLALQRYEWLPSVDSNRPAARRPRKNRPRRGFCLPPGPDLTDNGRGRGE